MTQLLFQAVLAYLVGSVSGSLTIGAFRHVDIRLAGSGNAGGTNAFRTQGFLFALGVVVIDIGKAALATGLIPLLPLPGSGAPDSLPLRQAVCALAVVLGHCFPLWHGFRGGKGAATAVGAVLVIQPVALIPMLATWLLTLAITGWVGLATILAGLVLVPATLLFDTPAAFRVFAVLLAGLLLFTHRGNIARMRNGSEHRFDKARLFRRRH